jgi:tetratricopeptide (TPR) repeat protein
MNAKSKGSVSLSGASVLVKTKTGICCSWRLNSGFRFGICRSRWEHSFRIGRCINVRSPIPVVTAGVVAFGICEGETPMSEGDAAYRAHQYDLAITKCTESIKRNGKDAVVYNNRALAYKEKGDYAHAIADFTKALRLKPEWFVYYNRGGAYESKGDENAAIADFTKAIQLSPPNTVGRTDSLTARAHCYFNQEKAAPAMADLNAAIKIGVDDPDPYVLRGILHKIGHNYDRSLADYEKAISLDPKYERAYGAAAYLLSVCPAPKFRDAKKAVAYATKSCELTGWKYAGALETLAGAYAEAGDFDQAIRWQMKATEIDSRAVDPKRLALYRNKQPFRDLNRKEEAIPNLANIKQKVAIQIGQRLNVQFDISHDGTLEPTIAQTEEKDKPNSLALDFHEEKVGRVLVLSHHFRRSFQARCLARLKEYDTYFETDILPVPVNKIGREIWSEPIEELVLFDFKVGRPGEHYEEDESEPKLSQRPLHQRKGPGGNFVLNGNR